MGKVIDSILIEGKKLFHSRIPLITVLVLMLIPFMGGFFMFVLKDPSLAESLGFISAKAEIIGTADWSSYFNLLSQAISIGGLFAFGFVASWIFGREYSDRTINDLLALPISRNIIVLSKFIITFLWCFVLSIFVLIVSFLVGLIVDIPGLALDLLVEGILIYIISSLLTIFLSTPVCFFASYGRGYLFPFGFIVVTLILAQIIAAMGYGEFFPWSIPAIISIGIGEDTTIIRATSIIIVLLTSLSGLLATIIWWSYVDQD